MFTILPSLYFVAVHYFRRWNVPHYDEQTILPGDEEEKKASNAYETYEHGLSKTSFDKQSLERIEKCDTSLLRSDPTPPMTDYYSLSRSEFDEKKNSNVLRPSQDEDNRPNQVKLRPKRPDRSSSSSLLLNTERRKTYTGELTDDDTVYLMDETGFTREQILLWHSDFLVCTYACHSTTTKPSLSSSVIVLTASFPRTNSSTSTSSSTRKVKWINFASTPSASSMKTARATSVGAQHCCDRFIRTAHLSFRFR